MKMLISSEDQNLILNIDLEFSPDLGKEECLEQFEGETLRQIINPVENYETNKFIHEPYSGMTNQCDIWFYFYFYNGLVTPTHTGGLDYSLVGISPQENAKMLKQSTKSFFRLEFFKTPINQDKIWKASTTYILNDLVSYYDEKTKTYNIYQSLLGSNTNNEPNEPSSIYWTIFEVNSFIEELPDRSNRRLVFSKNLSIPNGEKVFYEVLNDYLFVPVFMGSNFRKKENMDLYWFQDDTVLKESILIGNRFYMSARFFNADDGSIRNFGNKELSTTASVEETKDLYFLLAIDKSSYTYRVYNFNGTVGNRVGKTSSPINFYEISGG